MPDFTLNSSRQGGQRTDLRLIFRQNVPNWGQIVYDVTRLNEPVGLGFAYFPPGPGLCLKGLEQKKTVQTVITDFLKGFADYVKTAPVLVNHLFQSSQPLLLHYDAPPDIGLPMRLSISFKTCRLSSQWAGEVDDKRFR